MASSKRSAAETDLSGSSICNLDQEELLKSAKAKMGEVREENERLKKVLVNIVKDYESLEKKVSTMMKLNTDEDENSELVSLSLGSWISNNKNENDNKGLAARHKKSVHDQDTKKEIIDEGSKRRKVDGGLELGLQCRSNNEETEMKEREEQSLLPPQVKKTRVCIRSRCDTPTMNDGCQWRKYGQKIAKGNPCPRAYYRCTVSPSCPVRKQVQRCCDDMSILITTYEGTHNHSLPLAATTMASATTAAAAMLKSSSLTSSQSQFVGPTLTSSLGLHSSGLITPFNPNYPRLSISNPSMISASHNSHPTITLDLTAQNTALSPFNWLSSSSSISTKNSSNLLDFSSSSYPSVSASLDFTSKPWGSGYLSYHNSNSNSNSSSNKNPNNSQSSINETIAAVATKAIASNPNFQSALAAAISSYVGNKASVPVSNNNSSQTEDSSGSLSLFPVITSKSNSQT